MAIETPSIKQIYTNILNDIQTETGQTIPVLSKMFLKVLSLALSGVWIILYKYMSDAAKQRFPQTANEFYLEYLGGLTDTRRQKATYWNGTLQCVGSVTSGSILAGTQFINALSGNIYLVTESAFIVTGNFTVKIKAASAGTNYNLADNDILTFVSPLFGVANNAIVTDTTILAQDDENLEDYRQRVIDSYKRKPQGGAAVDYAIWGEEPTTILTVYPYANNILPGIVDLYIESSVSADGIPTTDELNICKSYVDFDPVTNLSTRKPLTAQVNYFPITRKAFNVTIIGLSPDSPDTRDICDETITNFFLELEPYILGVSVGRNDTFNSSLLTAAVSNALSSSEAFFSNLRIYDGVDEIFSAVMARGQKAKVGTITYV